MHDDFGFKKLLNTFVVSVACDEITTRGWVVNLEIAAYEKVILIKNINPRVAKTTRAMNSAVELKVNISISKRELYISTVGYKCLKFSKHY
ncbi:hypothetical protein [Clostridium tagluense]|uniref:Uncharacterized protein n=1 Tax=Clostridium tagluense TaxID=360422 RepID=A0A401UQ13_9CLOT|nr:hypothetical protein [Clostridium tagluense]GCD11614.1 hypothetical protein Ctaglu_32370 [Clostridium tagluense]